MIDKQEVIGLAERFIEDSGKEYFLVEVSVRPGNAISIEFDHMDGVSIDECVALSKYVEKGLDREVEDFELEVGSPVLTDPLRHPLQYQKFLGETVEVLLKNGQKKKGILVSFDGNVVAVEVTEMLKKEGDKRKKAYTERIDFPLEEIKWTKYIIPFK
ncbi:MAG: ribosome assembly cofactor RimP [Porphyromonas sp.]|nr:ribosome assembly cofactor RimP [Porphyromonas sp.]